MKTIKHFEIAPATAIAVEVRKGQVFRALSPKGRQAGDWVAFKFHNLREKFSAGRTRIENGQRLRITTGDKLYSSALNVMFIVEQDNCGLHDLLWPPCCRWVFEHRYRIRAHDGCLENLARSLKPWKLDELDVPDALNIFTNAVVDSAGKIRFNENDTPAGARIDLRAEMDCIVALSACACEVGACNAGSLKPLEARILEDTLDSSTS